MRLRFEFIVAAALLALSVFVFAAGAPEDYAQKRSTLDRELASECFALGQWCLEQGLVNEARAQFERALILQPDHAEAKQKLVELGARRAPGVACELRLVGGERVKAEFLMGTLVIRTDAGLLVIPIGAIDLIRVGQDGKLDHVVSDAFTGDGVLDADSFPARTKVTRVQVARRDLESVRLPRPCTACVGKSGKCPRCKATGQVNESCAKCKGTGSHACEKCQGTGSITCPLCNGVGSTRFGRGRMGRTFNCPRCNGAGKIDCPDCEKGKVVCADCKGKGRISGVCPECNGAKVFTCKVCGGTGIKPLPEGETDGDEKPAVPAPPPPPPTPAPPAPPAPEGDIIEEGG